MDLIDAVKDNNLERVRLLVEQGADKDEVDNNGDTPLFWASLPGHLVVTRYWSSKERLWTRLTTMAGPLSFLL